MDSLSSLDLPDSCLDSISYDPLDDAVTLVPCGHSFSKKTADLLISRRDKCPFDRADIESYVIAYKVRELVAERMEAEPETNREPSLEAVAHVREASQFYNTFNYPRAIDACIKAMNLCPNYQKAQVLLESSLLAQGREGSSKTNLDPEDCSCVKVIPSAPPLEEPVTPSAPPLEDIQPASNPVPKRRLFGDKKSAAVSDCATRLGLLKVRDEDAFGCLVFLSYLSAESISEFWLQILLVEQYEISLAEAMSRARSILKLLEQFQFIVYNEKTSTFSLTQKLPEDQQTSPIYEQTFAFFQEFGERCITNPALALQRGKEWILHMERILQHPLADRQVMLSKAKSYSLMGTIYRDCSQGGIYAVESFRLCVALKNKLMEIILQQIWLVLYMT
ncbi:MAG: hypothetical protein LVR00_00155 [Rhabdochlamydiaceae bacterium]|jgi:hypothetical protein